MAYRIEIQASAGRDLKGFPTGIRKRLDRAILALGENPRHPGSVKLTGPDDLYRVRVGDYRIVYKITDAMLVVLIIRIAHWRDVYR